ncbi:MAG: glycoside hydrolase family 38 C-terminal domain-containing protein [Chloroflexia bacterium]
MSVALLAKFAARIAELETAIYRRRHDLPPLRLAPPGVVGPQAPHPDWPALPVDARWGGYAQTVWLHGELTIPADWAGETVLLHVRLGDYHAIAGRLLIAGPEALAYLDGQPFAGVDRWHDALLLTPSARGGETFALSLEVYSGRIPDPHPLRQYSLVARDPDADALVADLRAARDALSVLDPAGADFALLARAIEAALVPIDFRQPRSDAFYASLAPARAALTRVLADYQHGARSRVVATGHAHIDVAWLWPLAQTRRKAARTFATALRLMEQYPDYHFTVSQPQLYAYIKEDEPALYAQIKARVAEGRWEPTGGMWLEPDTNVPRGESLVRQFVYGMRFFEQEFGTRTTLLWLPDVFGYSAALPQIMRGVGIRRFITSKLSWNDTNAFPHDTFRWRGNGGAEVLAHFITTPDPGERYYTYNGHMTAAEVVGTPRIYRQKDINTETLYLFGWGDGGGGVTREMLEAARRLGTLPGMPELVQGSAEDYFARLEERVHAPELLPRLPIWEGELYFEFHRGTYTSQGRTKYAHRRAELALRDAELWSSAAHATAPALPGDQLDDAWRLLLLQEFHDILPGSSVPEVYADADRDLARVRKEADAVARAAQDALIAAAARPERSLFIFNPTPYTRHDPLYWDLKEIDDEAFIRQKFEHIAVTADGQPLDTQLAGQGTGRLVAPPPAGIPPFGYLRCSLSSDPTSHFPLPDFRLHHHRTGDGKPLLPPRTRPARPHPLPARQARGQPRGARPRCPRQPADRLRGQAPAIRRLGHRRLLSRSPTPSTPCTNSPSPSAARCAASSASAAPSSPRDHPADHHLPRQSAHRLRHHDHLARAPDPAQAAFPVAIHAGHATYEVQFGNVERPTHRNTSWDRARFEVCAQRWADLSEGDYGVALLNDGKYGYDIHGNTMRLTLLKSGIMPDPNADQGRHQFTYIPPIPATGAPPTSTPTPPPSTPRSRPAKPPPRPAAPPATASSSPPATAPASSSTPSSPPTTAAASSSASTKPTAPAAPPPHLRPPHRHRRG